jgi:hypothetical protein
LVRVKEFDFWQGMGGGLRSCFFSVATIQSRPEPTLRCIAEIDGQPVAILLFSSAALPINAHDEWIGGSPRQRSRRLGMVVNNARFLVFPDRQKLPNLASRVLARVLQRLILKSAVKEGAKTRKCPSHRVGWAHGQEPRGSPCG